jgi:hypothetical protein
VTELAVNPFREAVRYCWAAEGGKLRKQTLLGLIGTSISTYGDVVRPIAHAVPWFLAWVTALGIIALANIAIYARRHGELTKPSEKHPDRRIGVGVPWLVKLSRDTVELAVVCCSLLMITWAGERTIATRSDRQTDSVSLFATLIPQLEGLRADVRSMKEAVGSLKKETSDDPRKELANIGVTWSGDTFLDAVRSGDLRALKLFVAGGVPMETPSPQGRTLAAMLANNDTNPSAVLDVLVGGGLDVGHQYEVGAGLGRVKVTLLSRAIEKNNRPLVEALLRHHANVNAPIQTFGAFGTPRDTYPLASAMSWGYPELAALLLDHGADPSVGDYAAYREAQAGLKRARSDASRQAFAALMPRLTPSGASGVRIADEVRLQVVEQELNDVALKSLRALRGTSQKAALDTKYEDLQRERKELQQRLGVHPQR